MNKMILRVGLALACVAFLATSMFGQFGTGCGVVGVNGVTASACDSCCDNARNATIAGCFKTGGKSLCSCLIGAFVTEGTCENTCAPPKSGPSCGNWGW